MNPQLEGIDSVEGTYPFDLRRSTRALGLNRFLWNLRLPAHRELFMRDEEQAFDLAGLSASEAAWVRERDWLAMVRYGVNFFVLEKLARVVKLSNLEVYARMRGESFDEFMKTRRVPAAR